MRLTNPPLVRLIARFSNRDNCRVVLKKQSSDSKRGMQIVVMQKTHSTTWGFTSLIKLIKLLNSSDWTHVSTSGIGANRRSAISNAADA